MKRTTTIYLLGALTGPASEEEAKNGVDLGFNREAATQIQLGEDANVYYDAAGALVVETGPLGGPMGGYLSRRTFPAWRVIEVEEVGQ